MSPNGFCKALARDEDQANEDERFQVHFSEALFKNDCFNRTLSIFDNYSGDKLSESIYLNR